MTDSPTRREQGKRDRLVAGARELLHQQGVEATTIADIALAADVPAFPHPRDPYTRVDILASSRHVRVEVEGVTVAESTSPRLLLETGLPVRYYLPKTHVRLDLLIRPTR